MIKLLLGLMILVFVGFCFVIGLLNTIRKRAAKGQRMIEHLQIIEHQLNGIYNMVAAGFFIVMLILGYMTIKIKGGG